MRPGKLLQVHLMRWWQLFSQIFLCSYPFPVHLKFIFTAEISWKVIQGKTMVTLQILVRFEEDGPLGPTPLDTYLLYYLLRSLSSCFLLLEHIIIKEWNFKPSAKAQILAPTPLFELWWALVRYFIILFLSNFTCTTFSTINPKVMFDNSFCFLFSKTCFWEYK